MKRENKLAMIVAFYLSKYGKAGLASLGFPSYRQAFGNIGRILSVNPNSIKNWRDEFDPYYDNDRKGWYQRGIRPSRQKIMLNFDDLSETALRAIILDIINPDLHPKLEKELHPLIQEIKGLEKTRKIGEEIEYVPRGPTGRSAEEFFISRFNANLTPFRGVMIDR